jgi:hypothetical protein
VGGGKSTGPNDRVDATGPRRAGGGLLRPGRPPRLNRGGDRQLNRALHTIVMIRQTHHAPTRAYTTRRITEGKSERDIRRCLKRTVARQLYRLLERTAPNQLPLDEK